MGAGKTTVCRRVKELLERSVFLDGDWLWDANPFVVTEETKKMVISNICAVLNNFLKCSEYDNIIFCWVMHRQEIIDELLSRLDTDGCKIIAVSLMLSEDELKRRLASEVSAGRRSADIIERSVNRLPLYRELSTIKIFTDGKSADEVAEELASLQMPIIQNKNI